MQRPSEMHKGLQSPLCISSHPVPSLGTSKMQRNSFSSAAASIVIILPNAAHAECGLRRGKIQAGALRSLLVCLESLTFL